MKNLEQKVSDYLNKWAVKLKEAKRSHFRVSAVKKAAEIVKTIKLEDLIKSNKLKSIKGIGKDIEKVILEIYNTGFCIEIDDEIKVKPIFYWWYSDKLSKMYCGDGFMEENQPFIVITPADYFDRHKYMSDGTCDNKKDKKDIEDTYETLEGLAFYVDISGCEGNCCQYNGGDLNKMLSVLNSLPSNVAEKNERFGKFLEEDYDDDGKYIGK